MNSAPNLHMTPFPSSRSRVLRARTSAVMCAAVLASIVRPYTLESSNVQPKGPSLPLAEIGYGIGNGRAEKASCEKRAAAYRRKAEYGLAYRLYARGVTQGWISIQEFYTVLKEDAGVLAKTYPERRLTVLFDDGTDNVEQWPLVRMLPEEKAKIWKRKGVAPKKDWLTEKDYKRISSQERFLQVVRFNEKQPMLTLVETRSVLERYDLLRDHIQWLLNLTENQIVDATSEVDGLDALRYKILQLKKEVRVARTRFVSYTLVSPFLAETVRLRRKAHDNFIQMVFNHRANAGKRLDAISMLALSCHKDILLSCTEDVRLQFCDTMSGLKRISRPVEWEHFQVVVTMLDSYDPGKKRGADAWWE